MTEITAKLSTALADRYRIEREIGEGGMATVYLAEDLKHKRKVAVKVLRPELAAVLGAERFALRRADHLNVRREAKRHAYRATITDLVEHHIFERDPRIWFPQRGPTPFAHSEAVLSTGVLDCVPCLDPWAITRQTCGIWPPSATIRLPTSHRSIT